MLTCFRGNFRHWRPHNKGKTRNLFHLLPTDILFDEILARIVVEDEGPKNLCRLSCVCKLLYEASNEAVILRKTKICLTSSLEELSKSYRNFVFKCSSMGNIRALAAITAVVFSYGCFVGSAGEEQFLTERLHASYFLGLILFESPSTRKESYRCLAATIAFENSQHLANFKLNAKRYLASFGINRPLNRLEISCGTEECGCRWIGKGYPPEFLDKQTWLSFKCMLGYHYEMFRLAAAADFQQDQ
ncbi:hypothetical protein QQP08_013407 [Theobroma cacao]|nr:hypothetical protein QQP08_013407 [Theobroma cacao]